MCRTAIASTKLVEAIGICPGCYHATIRRYVNTLIARFMGPTWGPSGADMTQVGPMLAPCTFLAGYTLHWKFINDPKICYLLPHVDSNWCPWGTSYWQRDFIGMLWMTKLIKIIGKMACMIRPRICVKCSCRNLNWFFLNEGKHVET